MGTFDWFEEVSGCFQASVGSVVTFGGETHGSAVRATGISLLVVAVRVRYFSKSDTGVRIRGLRSTAMPCQSNNHWTVAAIIIVILLL